MPYTPPTLADLRAAVARDLRDTGFATFATEDIDDFINFGIAEVNRVRPLETIEELDVANVEDTAYASTFDHIWRVEVWRSGQYYMRLRQNDGETSRAGWEHYAGELRIPDLRYTLNADTDVLRCWGYKSRDPLSEDTDVADFDLDAEHGCRAYAQYMGYQRMLNDRALFAQWQTQSNNSDVSPTQLVGMVATRAQEWDSLRNRIRILRRSA